MDRVRANRPFGAQLDRRNDEYKVWHDRFFRVDIVTATGYEYAKACIFKHNRYLVDNANLC